MTDLLAVPGASGCMASSRMQPPLPHPPLHPALDPTLGRHHPPPTAPTAPLGLRIPSREKQLVPLWSSSSWGPSSQSPLPALPPPSAPASPTPHNPAHPREPPPPSSAPLVPTSPGCQCLRPAPLPLPSPCPPFPPHTPLPHPPPHTPTLNTSRSSQPTSTVSPPYCATSSPRRHLNSSQLKPSR